MIARRPQRWAIVGTGAISHSVVADLRACPGVEPAVVFSRQPQNAARFAAEHDIAAWTDDLDHVLGDAGVDVLYVATPFATHHGITRAALRAGKHALVEKPMAMNSTEVRDLHRIAAERGRFLMEAMWMKFSRTHRRLLRELADGRIGEVRSLRAAFSMPFPPDSGSRWRLDGSPGSLLDQGIYPVTLAHEVLGAPVSVHAVGRTRDDGLDLAEHFTLEFDDGRFAQCASGMTEFTDASAAVSGTRGWIEIAPPFWAAPRLEVHADDLRTIFRAPKQIDTAPTGNGYGPMLTAIIEAIDRGLQEHPTHTAAETVAVFETLDTIRAQLDAARPAQIPA